jgi:hypothetical protein
MVHRSKLIEGWVGCRRQAGNQGSASTPALLPGGDSPPPVPNYTENTTKVVLG